MIKLNPGSQFVTFVLVFFFNACAFDKTFLYPDKLDKNSDLSVVTRSGTEQMKVHFNDELQPVFTGLSGALIVPDHPIESFFFENQDKNRLNAWYIESEKGEKSTTILFLHGNAGNLVSHYPQVKPLVKQGFNVLLFDYSGYGFSEGKASRDQILKDANAALNYLIDSLHVPKDKIVIYGQSLGGHLAINLAAQNQSKFAALVTEGAFSSHKNMAAGKAGLFGRLFVAEKYSGLKAIKTIQKPILLIHSKSDDVIPFKMGEQLFEQANEPKYFYPIDQCHICGPLYYADSIASKIRMITGEPER